MEVVGGRGETGSDVVFTVSLGCPAGTSMEGESGQKAGVREADRATQVGDSGAWKLSALPIPSQLISRHLGGFPSSACTVFAPHPSLFTQYPPFSSILLVTPPICIHGRAFTLALFIKAFTFIFKYSSFFMPKRLGAVNFH